MQVLYFIFLVSLGSFLGAYLRFKFLEYWVKRFSSSFSGICVLNIFSAFLFGILSVLYIGNHFSYPMFLLSSTGFIGSLSTFSSLSFEMFEYLLSSKWKEFSFVLALSLLGGPLAILFAYKLMNA